MRIPHFAYVEEVDVTELERLRARLNADGPTRPRLTLLPFIAARSSRVRRLSAAQRALRRRGRHVTPFDAVHLGVATQTETA